MSYREATFSTTAVGSGEVSFDWTYSFLHSWYMVSAKLFVFADTSSGPPIVVNLLDFFNLEYTDYQTFNGEATITVEDGYPFGIIVGGSNFDFSGLLQGTVTLSNFCHPADSDCDGVSNEADERENVPVRQLSRPTTRHPTRSLRRASRLTAVGLPASPPFLPPGFRSRRPQANCLSEAFRCTNETR